MEIRIVICFVVLLFVEMTVSFLAFAENEVAPSPASVLKKIADARRSLKSGHIAVEIKTQITGKPSISSQFEIYFDGAKFRLNRGNEVVCLDCYSKYTRYHYTATKADNNSNMKNALTFYDGYDTPGPRMQIADPRWTGSIATSFLQLAVQNPAPLIYDYDYEKNGLSMEVTADDISGIKCWKVTFPSPLNPARTSIVTIWVDQVVWERILRVEVHLSEGNYLERVEIQEVHENGWFPAKIFYQRFVNGKLERKIDELFHIHPFNDELPPNTFSPKGIVFLEAGTPVEWNLDRDKPVEGDSLEWDGEKVVAVDEFGKMMQKEPKRIHPTNLFFILLGIALISLAIGIELLKKSNKKT
jgi:hypothetical protein